MTTKPTPYQRAWLYVVDPTAAPPELLEPLYALGFRGVAVMIHSGSEPVPSASAAYLEHLELVGFMLAGWGTLDPCSPEDAAKVAAERLAELALVRYHGNAEDAYKWTGASGAHDAGSEERFGKSRRFLDTLRAAGYWHNVDLCTYPGCDLDHRAWREDNGRCYVETYTTGDPRRWTAASAAAWAVGMGWRRSHVKPLLADTRYPDGSRAPAAVLVQDCRDAGTLGFGVWTAESGDLGELPGWWAPFGPAIGAKSTAIAR